MTAALSHAEPLEEKPAEVLSSQPLLEHLIELRRRLIICLIAFAAATVLCYLFAADIYAILVRPLAEAFPDPAHRHLIYTGLTEAFLAYLKLALFGGFLLSFPVIAVQLYRFLAPGLYRREQQAFVPYLVASPLLFLVGASFAYFVVFPAAWRFFLSFERPALLGAVPIQLEARVGDYLNIVMHLIIAFGLSFQLPVVLALLVRAGVLSVDALKHGRRYAAVIIVSIAAFITPPDVFSQIALSVPLYLLYEISIFICKRYSPPEGRRPEERESVTGAPAQGGE